MKKGTMLLIGVCILLIITPMICAKGAKEEISTKPSLKVAVLLTGPISDQGWNMMAYNALKAVESTYGAEIAYTENAPASDYEEMFQGYAEAGFDVVMGHGFQFGDAATAVAKRYPNTKFIVTSTNISQAPNLASLRTNDAQSGFVQGAIAALMTKTGRIGYVGGMEIPSIISQRNGVVAGAQYVNPNIIVTTAYTGNFYDAAKAKEMARAMIEQGADIIVPDADVANLGIVEVAKELGAHIIGCTSDMGVHYPDLAITSLVENFNTSFIVLIGYVLDGSFEPIPYEMGLQEGTISVAPFRAQKDRVTPEIESRIAQIVGDISSGAIDINAYMTF